MKEIQMVDLKNQYLKIGPEIDAAIRNVIESAAYIKGPDVKAFEEELARYMGVKNVISCGNGTDALQIAMMALGLKPGDEIISTNFTFVATVEVIALLGLKLVLVDPDPDTFNISAENIRKAITPRTRAIVPVHLFGQCADMDAIMQVANDHNLFVIEDSAQATGTDYYSGNDPVKKAGTIGHIGTTSFFPSKNLGCYGDGGAIFTNDDELAKKIRSISNHGMKVRYYHDDIGVNSRLDTLQAAILRIKLRHLDEYNTSRRSVADQYDRELSGVPLIKTPFRARNSSHIFHQYTLKVSGDRRDELKKYLETAGIPSMIYYPVPLHTQKAYKYLGYREDEFPVTRSLCSEVLSLPVHTEFEQDQLEYIITSILKFFK